MSYTAKQIIATKASLDFVGTDSKVGCAKSWCRVSPMNRLCYVCRRHKFQVTPVFGSFFAVSALCPIETLGTSIPSVLIMDCAYYKVSLCTMPGGHHPTKRFGVENKSFAGMRAPSIDLRIAACCVGYLLSRLEMTVCNWNLMIRGHWSGVLLAGIADPCLYRVSFRGFSNLRI